VCAFLLEYLLKPSASFTCSFLPAAVNNLYKSEIWITNVTGSNLAESLHVTFILCTEPSGAFILERRSPFKDHILTEKNGCLSTHYKSMECLIVF
jgi:hypothetical protein